MLLIPMRLLFVTGAVVAATLQACAALETNTGPFVSVSASTTPIDLPLGDTARITITVRNNGDRPVEVADPGCNAGFFISDPDGNAYNQAELIYCTLELRAPVSLSPGDTHVIEAFTTGRVIPQGSQSDAIMLAPGTYRVRPVVTVRAGDEEAVVVSVLPVLVTFR